MKTLFKSVFLFILLLPVSALGQLGPDIYPVINAKPLIRFGVHIFFVRDINGRQAREIIVVNSPYIEIDKENQELKVWKKDRALYFKTLVSTGNPGIDEKGRQSFETLPGLFKVLETAKSVAWSKDLKVIMTDAIKIGNNEKYIHSLPDIGEYKDYEKLLGTKASHGCIRLNRKDAFKLKSCIEKCEYWREKPIIVYIFDKHYDFLRRYSKIIKKLGAGENFYLVENASQHQDILKDPFNRIVFEDQKRNYAVIETLENIKD